MIANFVTRTAIWIAALSLWASLHKPQNVGWIPTWAGMPTLVGGALVVTGIGLYVAGAVALARAKSEAPGTPTHLITDGPFGYVRNPVYLAMVIIVVGLSLLYQAWQVSDIVRTAILFACAHLAVVFLEEPATRRRFGEAYDDYCRRVPRWVPRSRPR
jgi:protein-S-isoprenylcysteine O-methyltransferase Ste14